MTNLWKKSQFFEKFDKKSQTSGKISQASGKKTQSVRFGDKKSQTSEKWLDNRTKTNKFEQSN